MMNGGRQEMRRTVLTSAATVLAGVLMMGVVFLAVTMGVALLTDSVRDHLGVSNAFELRSAAGEGDLVRVQAVLRDQPDLVTARDPDGWTPLHEAARGGWARVVDMLITSGAEVNARDRFGATPLHAAAKADEPKVVALLLDRGADPAARDWRGHTAAFYAARAASMRRAAMCAASLERRQALGRHKKGCRD